MRDVKAIDEDIDVERHILEYDVRSGENCADATATRARIDRLLDERFARTHTDTTGAAAEAVPS
jgi:hypothetical protein